MPISVEAESLLMHLFWVPSLSSIKHTQLIACSINSLSTDHLEKRPSELTVLYNVRGNYITFLKALLLPISRCQKHPAAGETISMERVKLIWENGEWSGGHIKKRNKKNGRKCRWLRIDTSSSSMQKWPCSSLTATWAGRGVSKDKLKIKIQLVFTLLKRLACLRCTHVLWFRSAWISISTKNILFCFWMVKLCWKNHPLACVSTEPGTVGCWYMAGILWSYCNNSNSNSNGMLHFVDFLSAHL